jgi:hypothetical protein
MRILWDAARGEQCGVVAAAALLVWLATEQESEACARITPEKLEWFLLRGTGALALLVQEMATLTSAEAALEVRGAAMPN